MRVHLPTTPLLLLAAALAAGCVSVKMPSEIAEAKKAAAAEKEAAEAKELIQAARSGQGKPVITHSYIGKDNQTVADIKQACVVEATQKLAQNVGTDVRSVVLENEVVTAKGKVVANCKLALME